VKKRLHVVVAGAGMSGLAAAALLALPARRERLRVTLVDAAPMPSHDAAADIALRVSAIATGSAELLDSIGAWARIRDTRACAYDRMRVWDESSSEAASSTLRFDAADFAVPQLGFIVENSLVRQALLEVVDAAGVELRFDTPIVAVRPHERRFDVVLGDDETLGADLLIAADGSRSFVRDCAGIRSREWPYGQAAIVTHLRPAKPHRNTAWQRFLRGGPVGMLPLPDGRISVVWSTAREVADTAMSASDETLSRMLSEASDYVLGELTVAAPRGVFPLCARHAERYVLPGLVLIGDAAHAVHPLAGQGANLGLQDAATLAAVIGAALEAGEHPGDRPVLRRYERARRGDNALMLHFMTGLNQLFATDSALITELRAAGMRLFNYSGPIRERAVRVALGMSR
jgi:2-polyprenylphenol 6-hydroxylase